MAPDQGCGRPTHKQYAARAGALTRRRREAVAKRFWRRRRPGQNRPSGLAVTTAVRRSQRITLLHRLTLAEHVYADHNGRHGADHPTSTIRMASTIATGALSRTHASPAGGWCSGTCCIWVRSTDTQEPDRVVSAE